MTSTTTVAISVGRAKAKTRPEIKTTTHLRAACALIVSPLRQRTLQLSKICG
jgi:hypothetical protein